MKTQKMFGTDGVRAPVGMEPMTPQTIMRLAHACGQLLHRTHTGPNPRPVVAVGTDTRGSAPMFEAALQAGFSAAGVDTVMCGELPTPGVAYLTRLRGYQAGVVVSASHNPCEDNGVKFFSATGDKLPDGMEADIERTMDQPMVCLPSSQLGRVSQLPEASSLYIEFCRKAVPAGVHLRGMKIVVDAAHGACHRIAPEVFRQLGAEVIAVGAAPDGQNINDKVGATSPQHLSAAVLAHQADVGVALDGDGDRLVMVDSDGRIFAGDELLYVLAVDAQTNDGLQGGVVGTVMSNQGLELALQRRGIGFARSAVGDRHVLELLKQRGWRLGGEGSGHLIGLDWHSTGDGVMSALRVVAAMQRSQRSLAQLCGDLRMNAQCLVNVPVAPGAGMGDGAWIPHFQLRAEQALGDDGRILLRASGTEPVVRVLVECRTALRAQQMASRFAQEVCQLLALPAAPQTATA
ncbi:phosphoglucosamine mutase [Acidovorax sp. JMULE5]|jgi:phosphoglucosamine mutase|uniref:phosphoglucosamine mutase n=1 Tax=Acidovorax sp. JMULE5 TaxID=2518343 RepID=UPI002101DCB3|nr:phosphoglucosamine mutase [Acidovorax sp. JMULE5]